MQAYCSFLITRHLIKCIILINHISNIEGYEIQFFNNRISGQTWRSQASTPFRRSRIWGLSPYFSDIIHTIMVERCLSQSWMLILKRIACRKSVPPFFQHGRRPLFIITATYRVLILALGYPEKTLYFPSAVWTDSLFFSNYLHGSYSLQWGSYRDEMRMYMFLPKPVWGCVEEEKNSAK